MGDWQELRRRVGERPDLETLSAALYRQSEGNALFLASFVETLLLEAAAEEKRRSSRLAVHRWA